MPKKIVFKHVITASDISMLSSEVTVLEVITN